MEKQSVRLPFEWRGARLYATGAKHLYVEMRMSTDEVGIKLYDGALQLIAEIDSLLLRAATAEQIKASMQSQNEHLYTIKWQAVNVETDSNIDKLESYILLGKGELANQLKVPAIEDVAELIEYFTKQSDKIKGVIIDATVVNGNGEYISAALKNTEKALQQVQELLRGELLLNSELVWVTKGAVSTSVDDVADDLAHSALWGLLRSARNEHQARRIRLIDIGETSQKELLILALSIHSEPELTIRAGSVLSPRIIAVQAEKTTLEIPNTASCWSIEVEQQDTLAGLHIVASDAGERALKENEVRIAVKALGINFLDVVRTLNMVTITDRPLLAEGSGIVLEVGSSVREFSIGDRVMGLFSSNGGTVSIADEALIAKVPANISLQQAATIPVTFLTAYYALFDLGQLKAGERVLIHAATGGTGMAAVR